MSVYSSSVTMRILRNWRKPVRMIQHASLEKTVLRSATRLIDLGSMLKCIPYKRVNPNDHTSIDLQFHSRIQFLLLTTLLCAHAVSQWISFFNYIFSQGLNAPACLHLNYLGLYTSLLIFSFQQILDPRAFMEAHNQIQKLQKGFRKTWTTHPVSVLVLTGIQGVLFISPFFTLGVYLLDPTAPMFVVTRLFNMDKTATTTGGYEAVKMILAALVELAIVFFSLLAVVSVVQTYTINVVARNTWMGNLRTLTKEAKTAKCSDWIGLKEIYQRIRVFSILSNCFYGSIILPGSSVLVVVGSAGSLFGTLRLHGHLHPVVYALFPNLAAFMIVGTLFGIYGEFSKVNRNSCDCMNKIVNEGMKLQALWIWNRGDEDIQYVQKNMRSLRSFGVQNGMFGYVTANTQIAMMDAIIEYLFLLLSL